MVAKFGWGAQIVNGRVRNDLFFVVFIRYSEIASPNEVVGFGGYTCNLFENGIYDRRRPSVLRGQYPAPLKTTDNLEHHGEKSVRRTHSEVVLTIFSRS